MKEEIKEILKFKENADYKKLSVDEIVILEDYITNLQEENEKLDNQNTINRLYWEKLEQRIEKTIEYITEDDLFYYGDELYDSYQEIINILKGDKDE